MRRGILTSYLASALSLSMLLAGCGSGTEGVPLEVELLRSSQQAISGKFTPKTERPTVTRALLDTIDEPVLEVVLERRDQLAYLNPERGGDDRGISVWRSLDNATLALRNGLLIETRGLGGDILSSQVQVQGRRPGPSSGGAHVQMIHSLDNRQVRLALACEVTDLGSEAIEIVEIRYDTRHLRQHCTGSGGAVTNDYWIDEKAGLIWKSRQWAGPHIGYLRLRRLVQ